MQSEVRCCPFCGDEFEGTSGTPDSRYASGHKCENCNEVVEITVNQFPVA